MLISMLAHELIELEGNRSLHDLGTPRPRRCLGGLVDVGHELKIV